MNNLESDFYDKNDVKKKVNALVRLHEAIQKKNNNKKKNKKIKTASYSKAIQIFTLVPDKWFRMYCS